MPYATVRDIEVYYEIHGTGERVVLISGSGADLRRNPARGSGRLERNFQVLMFDQRGLGQTSKPDVPYTMADYAEDCVWLMDAVGWDRANVVGISFGGMVAQHLVLQYPQRVERLVLACTSSGGEGGSSFDLLSIYDLPTEERVSITLPIMDQRNDLLTNPPTLAPVYDVLAPAMFAGELPLNADDPSWRIGARRQLEARAEHDVWDRLPEIMNKTLVAGGRYDGQAPVENMKRLAGRIKNSELQFFDGGHLFFLQDRAAWQAIVEFLFPS